MELHGYKEYLESRNYSEKTIRAYVGYIEDFLTENNNENVTAEEIQNYLYKFKDRQSTANMIIFSLRSYYDYLVNILELINKNPALSIKSVKTTREEKSYLTVEEVGIVLASLSGINIVRNKLIVILMALGCLRVSEVVNIGLDDIDPENKRILIRGKGNKKRYLYLTDNMVEYLSKYLVYRKPCKTNALFPSKSGEESIGTETIRAFLKKAEKETGIELNPHKFRHTGATLAYHSSKDIIAVQNLLGHENIETTKNYTHVPETNRRKLIEENPLNALF